MIPNPEREWLELRELLHSRAGMFSFVPIYVENDLLCAALKQRLTNYLAAQTRSLETVAPLDATTAADTVVTAALDAPKQAFAQVPLWLDLRPDPDGAAWHQARMNIFFRFNLRRSQLESRCLRPLLLVLPARYEGILANHAPDLWSVRQLSLHCYTPPTTDAPAELALPRLVPETEPSSVWRRYLAKAQQSPDWPPPEGSRHAPQFLLVFEEAQSNDEVEKAYDLAQKALAASVWVLQHRENAITLYDFIGALLCLSDSEVMLRRLPQALELAQDAVRQCLNQDRSPEVLRYLGVSLSKLGSIQAQLNQQQAALQSYEESLNLRRQLRAALGDKPLILRDLGISLNKVGNIQASLGQQQAALKNYEECLELFRQLRKTLGDIPQVLRDLSVTHEKIGNSQTALGQQQMALESYRESLNLRRQLRVTLGERSQVLRDISVALGKIGNIQAELGQQKAALLNYEESLKLFRQLREVLGDSPQVLGDLVFVLSRLDAIQPNADYQAEVAGLWQQLGRQFPDIPRYQQHAFLSTQEEGRTH